MYFSSLQHWSGSIRLLDINSIHENVSIISSIRTPYKSRTFQAFSVLTLIKKGNKILLISKEIQFGSGAKLYMRNIWGNVQRFHHIWGGRYRELYMTLHPIPLNSLIYEENFIFFLISVSFIFLEVIQSLYNQIYFNLIGVFFHPVYFNLLAPLCIPLWTDAYFILSV